MITKYSHVTIWVTDQDEAKDFYCNKLGFEERTDHVMEHGFRWLTVGPKTQPDLEICLMLLAPSPMCGEAEITQLKELVKKGALASGVFTVDDCHATYEELKAKGVEFRQEPKEQFYGIEALMVDPFGNWFSMTEPKG